MKELSRRVLAISPSLTLEIDAKAKAMRASGVDVIGFGAGEPDFDTPQYIKDAAVEALRQGKTKYTPASGTPDLKNAVCEKFAADNGLTYKPNQIVISNGAKHSLFNSFAALLNPGDEVIIPSPCWVSYPELVKINGGVPVHVAATEEQGFKPAVQAIREAVTDRTKLILINSPSNPCGYVMTADELRAIAGLAIEKDLYVVSDEIYEELVYDGEEHVSIASFSDEIKARTIVINGVSKAYAMTGWRIGYTASAPEIAKIMGSLQSHVTSNPNSIAQSAAAAALRGGKRQVRLMVAEFNERRMYMHQRINAIDGLSCITPKGAFYAFMNIQKVLGKSSNGKVINNSLDFCAAALEEVHVALVPGAAFEAEGFCRLSYATSMDNIKVGMNRLEKFVAALS